MRTLRKTLAVLLLLSFTIVPAFAQGAMMAHTCDSTLVTLLLVAEHDYGYLSSKMAMGEDMAAIDYGQYAPVIASIQAMMMPENEMMATEEAMIADDQMLTDMMAMDTAGMVASYMGSMNMTMDDAMMPLAPGNIEGEDSVCAEARADVEKFILAHILTDMSMSASDM